MNVSKQLPYGNFKGMQNYTLFNFIQTFLGKDKRCILIHKKPVQLPVRP